MSGVGQSVAQRERPLGVVVIALFLLADAIVALGQIIFDTEFSTRAQTLVDIGEWMPGLVVVVGILKVIAAVGLWFGSRRAWVAAMLVAGVGLLLSFYVYWVGDPAYARMLINVVIAFYLNQGAVRDYFEGRAERADIEAPGR